MSKAIQLKAGWAGALSALAALAFLGSAASVAASGKTGPAPDGSPTQVAERALEKAGCAKITWAARNDDGTVDARCTNAKGELLPGSSANALYRIYSEGRQVKVTTCEIFPPSVRGQAARVSCKA